MIGWNGSDAKSFSASRVILVGRESKGDRVRPGGLLEGVSCNGENATICVVRCCNDVLSSRSLSRMRCRPALSDSRTIATRRYKRLLRRNLNPKWKDSHFLLAPGPQAIPMRRANLPPNRRTGTVFTAAFRGGFSILPDCHYTSPQGGVKRISGSNVGSKKAALGAVHCYPRIGEDA